MRLWSICPSLYNQYRCSPTLNSWICIQKPLLIRKRINYGLGLGLQMTLIKHKDDIEDQCELSIWFTTEHVLMLMVFTALTVKSPKTCKSWMWTSLYVLLFIQTQLSLCVCRNPTFLHFECLRGEERPQQELFRTKGVKPFVKQRLLFTEADQQTAFGDTTWPLWRGGEAHTMGLPCWNALCSQ